MIELRSVSKTVTSGDQSLTILRTQLQTNRTAWVRVAAGVLDQDEKQTPEVLPVSKNNYRILRASHGPAHAACFCKRFASRINLLDDVA